MSIPISGKLGDLVGTETGQGLSVGQSSLISCLTAGPDFRGGPGVEGRGDGQCDGARGGNEGKGNVRFHRFNLGFKRAGSWGGNPRSDDWTAGGGAERSKVSV
jgi:hypothetical protein